MIEFLKRQEKRLSNEEMLSALVPQLDELDVSTLKDFSSLSLGIQEDIVKDIGQRVRKGEDKTEIIIRVYNLIEWSKELDKQKKQN